MTEDTSIEDYKIEADRHYKLRTAVYNSLYQWTAHDPTSGPRWLARLLGRTEFFTPSECMSEAEVAACEKLLGVYGYAYYRVLLARIEHD